MRMERRRVLFVCTHNSARSQMAEAMVNAWAGDRFEAHSAGTHPQPIRPGAVQVMAEIGIDIGSQVSKPIDRYRGEPFHWFVTVCDDARQNCPTFPGAEQSAHWSIPDPSLATGGEEERLAAFRQARDNLRDRIHMFLLAAGRDDLPTPRARSLPLKRPEVEP